MNYGSVFMVENKELFMFLKDLFNEKEGWWNERFDFDKLFHRIIELLEDEYNDCEKIVFDKRGQDKFENVGFIYKKLGFVSNIDFQDFNSPSSENPLVVQKIQETIFNPNIKNIYLVVGNMGYKKILMRAKECGINVVVFTTKNNANNFSGIPVIPIDDFASDFITKSIQLTKQKETRKNDKTQKLIGGIIVNNQDHQQISIKITFSFPSKCAKKVIDFIQSIKDALSLNFSEKVGYEFSQN